MALSRKESMNAVPFSSTAYCPMRPGMPYVPPYAIGAISAGSQTVGLNHVVRFPIGRRCVLTQIYFAVTTAVTSAAVDLAWYRFNADSESLTHGGIIATNVEAATVSTKTVTCSIPVEAGQDFFLGMIGRTAAPTIRRTTSLDWMLDHATPATALSSQGFTGFGSSSQGVAIPNSGLTAASVPRLAIAAALM